MPIFASCGHEVHSGSDLIPVEYDDEEIDFDGPEPGFVPVTIQAQYCPECAAKGINEGTLRRDWRA